MSAYINALRASAQAEIAERNKIHEAEKQVEQMAVRERLIPLELRLKKLLATIPVEIQAEGLALTTLQASLKGRWRGSCHPGELGTALRKLGYKRVRKWSGEAEFRALWYPISQN